MKLTWFILIAISASFAFIIKTPIEEKDLKVVLRLKNENKWFPDLPVDSIKFCEDVQEYIECKDGRVSKIVQSHKKLKGEIPRYLSSLDALTSL